MRSRVRPPGAVGVGRAVITRLAVTWAGVTRAAVVRPAGPAVTGARAGPAGAGPAGAGVVGAGVVVGGCVGAGRDERQGVEQEAEVGVGAEQVDAAAGAGGLHGASDGGEAGHGGGGVHGGQVHAGQGGGVVVAGVQADAGAPLGGLAAFFGALRVGEDDRAGHRGAELAVGLAARGGQDLALDGAGVVVGKDGGGLGDDPGAGQVDLPVR